MVWRLIDLTVGARVSPHFEELGRDYAEFGIGAFPEFMPVVVED